MQNQEIKLSAEQAYLFKVMEETNQHLFITGRAGAGKSVLLRYFKENTKKRSMVAAPTGIAAMNVGGVTLHSGFKLPFEVNGILKKDDRLDTILRRVEVLIIDEVSMVAANILDSVSKRFKQARENDLPFGGVQVIMFGDVYQLPPVIDKSLMQYFEKTYGGIFFFNAHVWRETDFKIYELSQVFRQKDPAFKDILNAIRDGSVDDQQIKMLNDAACNKKIPAEGVITLAPTNALVTRINQQRLDALPGKAREYRAIITGQMKQSAFPTEEILQLKEGAQIVFLKNDKDKRWVNGTVGKIEKLYDNDDIEVNVNGAHYLLEPETWEEIAYTIDPETDEIKSEVVSSFTQFPIRLAFALTVHKSQGQTYAQVAFDLSTGTFAAGQMYVALSRATSLEGLYLRMPVLRKHIITDAKVKAFMARRETIELVEEEETPAAPVIVEEVVEAPAIEVVESAAPVAVDVEPAAVEVVDEKPAAKRRGRPAGSKKEVHKDKWQGRFNPQMLAFFKSLKNATKFIEELVKDSDEYQIWLASQESETPEGPDDSNGGGAPAPVADTSTDEVIFASSCKEDVETAAISSSLSEEEIAAYDQKYSTCMECDTIYQNKELDEDADNAPCGHPMTGIFDISSKHQKDAARLHAERIAKQKVNAPLVQQSADSWNAWSAAPQSKPDKAARQQKPRKKSAKV